MTEQRERQPSGREWQPRPVPQAALAAEPLAVSCWASGPIFVISSLVDAELPDGSGTGLQWQLSLSLHGKRPKPHHVRRTLRAFGIVGAEQDNHHPGVALHFWVPLDPSARVECQCKSDEDVIVEPDGYTWTNPKEGECRGCELERISGKRCPLHGSAAAE